MFRHHGLVCASKKKSYLSSQGPTGVFPETFWAIGPSLKVQLTCPFLGLDSIGIIFNFFQEENMAVVVYVP